MPRYSINPVINKFKTELNNSYSLLRAVNKLPAPRLSQSNEERIVELAFLKIYAAWENFLENSMIRYMAGAKSLSGYEPVRYVTPPTIEKAKFIFIGNIDGIPRWSGEHVRQKSIIYFENGEPFSHAISSISVYLNDIVPIRNAIAHGSDEAIKKFKKVVINELPSHTTNITPGRFLLMNGPKLKPNEIFFEFYSDMLLVAAEQIVQ